MGVKWLFSSSSHGKGPHLFYENDIHLHTLSDLQPICFPWDYWFPRMFQALIQELDLSLPSQRVIHDVDLQNKTKQNKTKQTNKQTNIIAIGITKYSCMPWPGGRAWGIAPLTHTHTHTHTHIPHSHLKRGIWSVLFFGKKSSYKVSFCSKTP